MPKLTSSAVDSYLAAFDKKLEKISVDLYKDGFINFTRISGILHNDNYYFKAEYCAQMKLRVS